MMQPDRDSWRVSQRGAAPDRAIGRSQDAVGQQRRRHGPEVGSRPAAPPHGGVGLSSGATQCADGACGAMTAALAKLRECTEGGTPPVSAPANRVYQDALSTLHDALMQAR